jgi:predicted  nucleic acid-binding Zn-ribbon protein
MSSGAGLKDQWGVDDPAKAGSDQQSQQFQAAFQQEITAVSGHLEYTAANAETARHDPLAARRDALYPSFQGALGQVDRTNPKKAQGAITKVLGDTNALNAEASKLHQETEKAKTAWDGRAPKLEEAVQHVEELEAWEDLKAPALRGLVDGIRAQVNDRKWAPATKTLDQLLPKLEPIYAEYLKQKAAKEQYEPALQALQPRLAQASTCQHAKLQPQQQELAAGQQAMEASAQSKDYVQALKQLGDLTTKVDTFEKALAELEQQKKAYEDAWSALEPKYQPTQQSQFAKLAPMQQDMAAIKGQIDGLLPGEDYVQALKLVNDLATKVDTYQAAVDELQKQKQAFDDARAALDPRLKEALASQSAKLAPQRDQLSAANADINTAAQGEDYAGALKQVNDLSAQVDAYKAAADQLAQQTKQYEDALAGLQPKLAETQKSQHPKLAPMQDDMGALQKQMETAAQGEDYEQAANLVKDLSTKVDDYTTAAAQLDQQKKAYEDALAAAQPRLKEINASQGGALGAMQQEIATIQGQIDEAAKKEDYDQALALVNDLTKMLDDYKSTEAGQVYKITYEGKDYYGTAEDLAVLRAKISAAIIASALPPLKNRAEANENWYRDLKAVRDEYVIIGAIVNAIGGADLNAIAGPMAGQKPALDGAAQALTGDMKSAEDAYRKAVDAINATSHAISEYIDAIDTGGKQTITALQVVEVGCFAIGAAAGAAVLAPAGAGLLATAGANAAAGAGFGALQSLAESGAHNLIMTGEQSISPGDIVTNAALAAVTSGVGAALGTVAGKQAGTLVVERIMVQFGFKQAATRLIITGIVEGSLGNTVQSVVAQTPDILRGRTTWEKFASAVATAFIVGGIAGGILSKMNARNREDFKGASDEEIDAAIDEVERKAGKGKKKVDDRTTPADDLDSDAGEGKRTAKQRQKDGTQSISGGKGAGDLETWARGQLSRQFPDQDSEVLARRFMESLQKGHEQGLPHDHLAPGSREAQQALQKWINDGMQ